MRLIGETWWRSACCCTTSPEMDGEGHLPPLKPTVYSVKSLQQLLSHWCLLSPHDVGRVQCSHFADEEIKAQTQWLAQVTAGRRQSWGPDFLEASTASIPASPFSPLESRAGNTGKSCAPELFLRLLGWGQPKLRRKREGAKGLRGYSRNEPAWGLPKDHLGSIFNFGFSVFVLVSHFMVNLG